MKFLLSALTILPVVASAQTFGPATDFNVFVTGDFTSQGSDTEGRMAIGGNASLDGYDVAIRNPGGDVLVVGGNLTTGWSGGTVRGNLRTGGTFSAPNQWVMNVQGTTTTNAAPTIDFAAAGAQLQSLSNSYAGIASTGTSAFQWNTLTLTGSLSGLNVFSLSAADLANPNLSQVLFNLPAGASALVNVTGSDVTFRNIGWDNIDPRKLIWNLPNTTSINLPGSLDGSIFAPQAAITGQWGVIEGQVIARSFSGNTQINWQSYNGAPVPEPASMAVVAIGLAALKRRRAKKCV